MAVVDDDDDDDDAPDVGDTYVRNTIFYPVVSSQPGGSTGKRIHIDIKPWYNPPARTRPSSPLEFH